MKQLTSDEVRELEIKYLVNLSDASRRKVAGLFEAVIARAERAEAENAALRAQLEAQGWRAFTPLPPVGEWIQIQSTFLARRDDDDTYHIPDTSTWEGWRPALAQDGE